MPEPPGDVVDEILGIEPGSALAELRAQRPEARAHTEGSYREIFEPRDPGGVAILERFAIALRVAAIHRQPELVAHYSGRLPAAADRAPLAAAPIPAAELIAAGTVSDPRLAAILGHAELLATGPAAATPDDLERLRRAGLGVDEIVIVSQTIAFLSFQARLVAGLSLIAPRGPGS
jgi:CMD domain protein